jgi:DNA-binding transcriptional LysR family regulator
MNTDFLETFLEVVRLGSLSEAARRLGISQSAISQQLQRLEQEIGLQLIDRSERGAVLTPAGRRFHRFAEAVVAAKGELARDLDEMRDDVIGSLVLASSTIPGEFLVPRLLSEFRRLHPAVVATVTMLPSLTVVERLNAGDFDIGFSGLPPAGSGLEAFPVGSDTIVLVVPAAHPLAGRPSVTVAELRGQPFVLREETSGTQRSVEAALRPLGLDLGRPGNGLRLGTTQAVVSAIEAGLGIGFISDLAVEKSVALGRLRVLSVDGVAVKRRFFCVYRPRRIELRLEREFLAFAREWGSRQLLAGSTGSSADMNLPG